MPTPIEIATWRFELIAPLIDPTLSSALKRSARQALIRREVVWPNGQQRRIPRTTLQRWIRRFAATGFDGLLPRRRKDRGQRRRDTTVWIEHAIRLLLERPERSLYQLRVYLAEEFPGFDLSRASLARQLKTHPTYATVAQRRDRKPAKLWSLYEAGAPHESWQLDGKGPFRVTLSSGQAVRVHVLTILDDHSRAVLAACVARAEDQRAAIGVFQKAVLRFGLPARMQFDHGSAFDRHAFRSGLARLGVHRNAVRAKNPRAQGKIESFNKSLGRWFVAELAVQEVRDLAHLQELLDAFIALIYQKHPHRSLGCSPEEKLAGKSSARQVSASDLSRAFFVEVVKKSDPATGEVRLESGRFIVPRPHAGQRSRFRFDPLLVAALLVTDDDREIALAPFVKKPLPPPVLPNRERPQGQLQKLVERFQGRVRDNAEPAFGLPEVFRALQDLVGRAVPASEDEAELVLSFWKRHGPIARRPFLAACTTTERALSSGRPLAVYLQHLERQITHDRANTHTGENAP